MTETETELPGVRGKYQMTVSRLTVDKLGIKLYDRVTAVLAELIANSYDADSPYALVELPLETWLLSSDGENDENLTIVISDEGHGMTSEEVNKAYLQIGSDRRRRTGTDLSRSGERRVMGRKGIGKLAPFGICQTIEVVSAGGEEVPGSGFEVSHLILRLGEILEDTDQTYLPEVGELDGTFQATSGTKVTLSDFYRKRVPNREELDRQIAARFGLQRAGWEIVVSDTRGDQAETDFVVGELKIDILDETLIDLGDRPVIFKGEVLPVAGWVAYSKRPYKDPAMAGVRIYARGKIVSQTRDFGIGSGFTGEFKLRSYLVGVVHAEWLDEDQDLVRSDRQDIIWNSELGDALTEWGQGIIKELASRAESSVKKAAWDEFVDVSHLEERLEQEAPSDLQFRSSVREAARLLVTNNDREALQDPDHVERIVRLALALGPHRSLLEALGRVSDSGITTLGAVVELFEQARIAEIYSLGQIAQERIDAVGTLEMLVGDAATLEQPLQLLIEGAPWILAPEWTPLGMNESLKRIRASFEAWYQKKHGVEIQTSAINRERKEPDFVLLHDAGTLWIVEIKRMNYRLTDAEFKRATDYLESLEQFLEENPNLGNQFPHRRLTFVVDYIDGLGSVSKSALDNDPRLEWRTWADLLDSTKRAHKDFLSRVDELKGVAP